MRKADLREPPQMNFPRCMLARSAWTLAQQVGQMP
jgi:hypothetical protein